MTRVTVQPSGIEYEVPDGETMMGAAHACGLYWPTTCGGQGICTTCLVEIVSGADSLVEMGRSERKTLIAERGEAILSRPVRLACQTIVRDGPSIVVKKPGVRSTD